MTIRTESSIKIASGVPEVWAYVCDVGRWPEWAPTVLECRVRGGTPLQPGSRGGRELEPVDDGHTDAKMWIEVDLAGIMRAVPGRTLQSRIQRVSDLEMT